MVKPDRSCSHALVRPKVGGREEGGGRVQEQLLVQRHGFLTKSIVELVVFLHPSWWSKRKALGLIARKENSQLSLIYFSVN